MRARARALGVATDGHCGAGRKQQAETGSPRRFGEEGAPRALPGACAPARPPAHPQRAPTQPPPPTG